MAAVLALTPSGTLAASYTLRQLSRAGLVSVRHYALSIRTDVRFAGRRNFTGRRLPGYCRPWALLRRGAARRLAQVQRSLRPRGLGLLVFDAYRPPRATTAMVRWAVAHGHGWWVGPYLARHSKHSLATSVDLTLVHRRSGRPLRMGTGYLAFGPRSNTENARGLPLHNRLVLRQAMARGGFLNYGAEWWHYNLSPLGKVSYRVPLGCHR